jgi:hypothetical protein
MAARGEVWRLLAPRGRPDIEVYFELPAPAVHDELDEDSVEKLFLAIPSGERH